jgi:hypothetical protein
MFDVVPKESGWEAGDAEAGEGVRRPSTSQVGERLEALVVQLQQGQLASGAGTGSNSSSRRWLAVSTLLRLGHANVARGGAGDRSEPADVVWQLCGVAAGAGHRQ